MGKNSYTSKKAASKLNPRTECWASGVTVEDYRKKNLPGRLSEDDGSRHLIV